MSLIKDSRTDNTLEYKRHKPEETLLYQIISKYYPKFLAHMARQRINEDITMRKLATKTQIAYIRGVNKLCQHLQHRPENTSQELS